MTHDQLVVRDIQMAISALRIAEAEACFELAEHIKRLCKSAGNPVGPLALALAGAEAVASNE
jgi:hypothetical protein